MNASLVCGSEHLENRLSLARIEVFLKKMVDSKLNLLMTGFELRISGVRSDSSTKLATTTALLF